MQILYTIKAGEGEINISLQILQHLSFWNLESLCISTSWLISQ